MPILKMIGCYNQGVSEFFTVLLVLSGFFK